VIVSTFLGGRGEDSIWGVAVDSRGEVYVAGTTDFSEFAGRASGGEDLFVARLDRRGRRTRWVTRIGGWENEHAGYDGGIVALSERRASRGAVWVAGAASSLGLATGDAWQKQFGGGVSDGMLGALDKRTGKLCLLSYSGGEGDESMKSVAVSAHGGVAGTRLTVRRNIAGEVVVAVSVVTAPSARDCR
jgi:hypothetical protein